MVVVYILQAVNCSQFYHKYSESEPTVGRSETFMIAVCLL